MCDDFDFILRIAAYLFKLLQFVVPIVLILLITFDMAKIMINGDEKAKKDGMGKAAKRLIYAVIIFLVPIIIKFTFKIIGDSRPVDINGNKVSTTDWISCFNKYFN